MNRYQLLALILFLSCLSFSGRDQDATTLLDSYFTKVHAGEYPAVHEYLTLSENPKAIIDKVSSYINDKDEFMKLVGFLELFTSNALYFVTGEYQGKKVDFYESSLFKAINLE